MTRHGDFMGVSILYERRNQSGLACGKVGCLEDRKFSQPLLPGWKWIFCKAIEPLAGIVHP